MRILAIAFLILSIIAAGFGSMQGVEPVISMISKVALFISIILCLVFFVGTAMKENEKTIAH